MSTKTIKSTSDALRQLLQDGKVGTQEDICKALLKQGHPINQSKVSRLLNKIGAIKVTNPDGKNTYRLPHEHGLAHEHIRPHSRSPSKLWVIDVVANNVLIVIHTTPGAGALVAREIDLHHRHLGILGSIAGDDTIFIAPKDTKQINKIVADIKTILEL